MIVDAHTHVFPPAIIARRDRLQEVDPTFAELYSEPKATLAAADDLMASMQRGGIDVSVALGFAWRDAGLVREHNDYLIEAAKGSGGQILAFCTLPLGESIEEIEAEMRRCTEAGARGFGELRPENLSFEIESKSGERLAHLASELGTPLLFHVTEPVGHRYAGKGGLSVRSFYDYAVAHPATTLIGAHWGGGLPFYSVMPEVRALDNVLVDTAATSLLYAETIYESVARLAGAQRVLFGSDYPLLSQSRSRRRIEEAGLEAGACDLLLGGNAARLLGLG